MAGRGKDIIGKTGGISVDKGKGVGRGKPVGRPVSRPGFNPNKRRTK